MAVQGFGANAERAEEQIVPSAHVAYRRFRFTPKAHGYLHTSGYEVQQAWEGFCYDVPMVDPWAYYDLGASAAEVIAHYMARRGWWPSLTAAAISTYAYKPGENIASCYYLSKQGVYTSYYEDLHKAPMLSCECGFWAYHNVEDTHNVGTNETHWMTLAAVEVYGKTVLGTKGVRAEKMKIIGLVLPLEVAQLSPAHPIRRAWDMVVEQYGVPTYGHATDLVKAHPSQDISRLLSKPKRKPMINPEVMENGGTIRFPTITAKTGSFAHTFPAFSFYVPAIEMKCCMCKCPVSGDDEEKVNRMLAEHMLDVHMDWQAYAP